MKELVLAALLDKTFLSPAALLGVRRYSFEGVGLKKVFFWKWFKITFFAVPPLDDALLTPVDACCCGCLPNAGKFIVLQRSLTAHVTSGAKHIHLINALLSTK